VYLKAIRVLLAERRARAFLDATLRARRTGAAAPAAPRDTGGGH
jgi:hypothetical protein